MCSMVPGLMPSGLPPMLAYAAPQVVVEAPGPKAPALPPVDPTGRVPSPPLGFEDKVPLSWDDYLRKNEGGYFTGLPLVNFDTNTGFGGGLRIYYYYNGDRDDPLFGYTPYQHRVFLQVFGSTGGLQFHWLDYDAPAIFGTPYRLRVQAIFERNLLQNFFGVGSEAMGPLTFTGAGRSYDSFAEYTEALERIRPDGTTLARYDQYDLTRPLLITTLERTFLGGLVRPLFGFGFFYNSIRDYSRTEVEGVNASGEREEAIMGQTRLAEQCEAGDLIGCDGGWDNVLRLGLSFDTRDFEPDPNSGFFFDVALDLGTGLLGSGYRYARFLTSVRGFYSPFPDQLDLVLATRATFQLQTQGTPFFSLDLLPYTEDNKSGLGGLRTLRGYRQDRFIGNVITLLNWELRWTFTRFAALGQQFALFLVPFADLGRVYDSVNELSFDDWATSGGGALRISWNQATIISVDYGVSPEDTGLYINFTHQF